MADLVKRDGSAVWYVKFKSPTTGRWERKSTGTTDEVEAREVLAEVEKQLAAAKPAAPEAAKPLTVAAYADTWLTSREGRVRTVNDDRARLRWALDRIGTMRLDEVRVRHVRDLIRQLRALKDSDGKPDLAPRSVLHVYRTLRTMFQTAIREELDGVTANPCQLGREDLPKKVDRDPAWRATAVFTRGEVETIISDERIPIDRRVLNALLALTGMRFGEVAALRWGAYDRTQAPLGRISVHVSYDKKAKEEKEVKTGTPRLVPVHPTLAAVLAEWRLTGWRDMIGRAPKDDDLIIPTRLGNHRGVRRALYRFHEDLERVGIRPRRQHDMRRTFITLALADGARKDVLRWVTHGPEGDIVDLYTTLPWSTLCEAVAVLRIERRVGVVVELPIAQAAGTASTGPSVVVQSWSSPANVLTMSRESRRGGRDSNPRPPA